VLTLDCCANRYRAVQFLAYSRVQNYKTISSKNIMHMVVHCTVQAEEYTVKGKRTHSTYVKKKGAF
jgi:hypothetical protein